MISDYRPELEKSLNTIFKYNQFEHKYCGDDILLIQIINELDLYLQWLSELREQYNIKNYQIEHIAEQIFTYITKDNFKYHIEAMYMSVCDIKEKLDYLFDELSENDKDYDEKITIGDAKYSNYIRGQLALLNDLIIDFNEVYWQIEEYFSKQKQKKQKKQKRIKRISGKRRILMGREIWEASIIVLHRMPDYNTISYNVASIFLLRQTIEVTISKALGIVCFLDKNGEEQKIKFDKILDFIEKNKQYIEFPISKSLLKKIINWSNKYIHKGFIYLNWQIIISQKILAPLFCGGKDDKQMSIFGAIKINRNFYENNMETELINFLFKNNTNNIQLKKFDKPDCLLTDNTFV